MVSRPTVGAGDRFGRLVVTARAEDYVAPGTRSRQPRWTCRCDCGREKVVRSCNLLAGQTLSCGCRNREARAERNHKHGQSARGGVTRAYKIWCGMIDRCTNPNAEFFPRYGGRGIAVCERWRDFRSFFADMGKPLDGQSIERINLNGHYEPGNCRWATAAEQARNTSRTRLITRNGVTKCLKDWCADLGLNYSATLRRVRSGVNFEEAVKP